MNVLILVHLSLQLEVYLIVYSIDIGRPVNLQHVELRIWMGEVSTHKDNIGNRWLYDWITGERC
jgi:hypothetical protein